MSDITDGDGFTLFDHDKLTGRTVWSKIEDGKRIMRVDTPVDAILEANQAAHNDSQGKRFSDWTRVASIPLNHAFTSGFSDAVQQNDNKWLSTFLNDGDNRKFRTFRGNV